VLGIYTQGMEHVSIISWWNLEIGLKKKHYIGGSLFVSVQLIKL
jgi:hypothetical protein